MRSWVNEGAFKLVEEKLALCVCDVKRPCAARPEKEDEDNEEDEERDGAVLAVQRIPCLRRISTDSEDRFRHPGSLFAGAWAVIYVPESYIFFCRSCYREAGWVHGAILTGVGPGGMSSAKGNDISPELKRLIESETDAQDAKKSSQQLKYERIVERKQRDIQCYLAATVLRLDRVNLAQQSCEEFEKRVDDYYQRVTAFLTRKP